MVQSKKLSKYPYKEKSFTKIYIINFLFISYLKFDN